MAGLYEDEILGAQQQRDLARKLRDTEVPSTGHMIGDWYVAPTVAQQLSAVLKQGIGAYKENQAEDEIKGLKQERARSSADAFSQMGMQAPSGLLAEAGTPAVKPSIMDRLGAALTFNAQPKGTPAQPYQQTIAQNVTAPQSDAAMLSLMSSNPELGAGAIGLSNTKAVREATATEKAYQHQKDKTEQDWNVKKFNQQQAFQEAQREQDRALKESMAQLAQSNRQGPQGSVVEIIDPKDNTKMIKINSVTGEIYGTSGAEPKAAIRQEKAQAAEEKTAKARENFASELDIIESNYNFLNKHGGITSTKKGPLDNISSYLSDVTGPTLGAMVGSSNQSARDTIAGARSRMIPMFKDATNMSSKQMDSNAELLAAKKTLTDPEAGYEANMKAIDALKREYTKHQTSGDIHSQADAILGK
jgi:hypothetical protein